MDQCIAGSSIISPLDPTGRDLLERLQRHAVEPANALRAIIEPRNQNGL